MRRRITCVSQESRSNRGQHWGKTALKMAKWRRGWRGCGAAISFIWVALCLGRHAGRIVDFGAGSPVHRNESRGLLDPPQPGADRGEGREVVVAVVGDMGVGGGCCVPD